ncbi:glycosyltransferase [Desulfitobacterium sp. PCE1]|uniref:glycosyltransferase n=1 Tax=Desulfitobacterium sp. PCE1 TaxID=146907 RepID=UPI00036A6FC9|nr:glycosyltransferase [Desulfitobacterium sp. PCE1]
MTRKVIFRTFVFRGGNVLCQATESLLKQTYSNFAWHVLDISGNGLNKELLSKYNDSRIIYVDLSSSHTRKEIIPSTYLEKILEIYSDDDYFAVLDADDIYTPNFVEKMLNYMEDNNLDAAACGSDFIDMQSGKLHDIRILKQNLIWESSADFQRYFTTYYQFMRTVWGKIFKLSCLRKCDFGEKRVYGNDTLFTMEAFRNAKRVGILAESLHKYYMSQKSVSYHFDPIRIPSDSILYDAALKYLRSKCGVVTPFNEDFLLAVYMNAIKDTLNVLLNAKISLSEKLDGLCKIFTSNQMKQLAAREDFGTYIMEGAYMRKQRQELFSDVANWLLALNEVPDEQVESFVDVGEFVCAAAQYADGWIVFKKLRMCFFIGQERWDDMVIDLTELEELLPNDEEILEFRKKLNSLSPSVDI